MDFELDQDQLGFKARFEQVCRERIAPHAADADRRGALPRDHFRVLAESGYLQLFHPRTLGGLEADGVTLGIAMEALAQSCASTLWAATISAGLFGKILHALCDEHHHELWLRPIIRGERVGCFAATEEGSGSDPSSYHTSVRRSGGGYRLTGIKQKISNAGIADVAVVLARHEGQLCYVVVDLHRPGVRRTEQPKVGLRAMSWGTLTFEDVEIAREDVILDADMETTLRSVEWGQLLQSFCAIGLAEAALQAALTFARERVAFGRPIAHLETVHGRLADMRVEIDAARWMALEAAWAKGRGVPARELVMMTKIHATEMSVRVADAAMRTLGGSGFGCDHVVERLYRDSLANVPAGLTTDRLRELVACPMVGADPWSYPPFEWLSPAGLGV